MTPCDTCGHQQSEHDYGVPSSDWAHCTIDGCKCEDYQDPEPLDLLPEESKERLQSAITSFMDARVPGWREAPPGITYIVEPTHTENIGPVEFPPEVTIVELTGPVVRIKP